MPDENAIVSGTWYFTSQAAVGADGTIVVPGTARNGEHTIGGVTIVEPGDPNFELWQWLLANRELYPVISPDNAAAVHEAFRRSRETSTEGSN